MKPGVPLIYLDNAATSQKPKQATLSELVGWRHSTEGSGFGVQGSGFGVWGLGFRV